MAPGFEIAPDLQNATEAFAVKLLSGEQVPMPSLDARALCLMDLPMLVRGAERIAVLALGGLPDLLLGASLLSSLQNAGRTCQIQIFCAPVCAELLDGFQIQAVDPKRYLEDGAYREEISRMLSAFSPELVVNLDRERGIEADDLISGAPPAGALGFELPIRGQEEGLIKALNEPYRRFLKRDADPETLLAALGMESCPPKLWPLGAAQDEARALMEGLGWDSGKTLALIVDHPAVATDPDFQSTLQVVLAGDWRLIGLGGRGTYGVLETLLSSLEEGRAVNLAGSLGVASLAALMGRCAGYLGGTPMLRSMAQACGCRPAWQILPPPSEMG
jgi:hypothetical protein